MLNHFRNLFTRLCRLVLEGQTAEGGRRPSWCSDPLSHPELEQMSLDQLADLPFDPTRICDRP